MGKLLVAKAFSIVRLLPEKCNQSTMLKGC